jgi:hypothetical protein
MSKVRDKVVGGIGVILEKPDLRKGGQTTSQEVMVPPMDDKYNR